MIRLWSLLLAGTVVASCTIGAARADLLPATPPLSLKQAERLKVARAVEWTIRKQLKAGWTTPTVQQNTCTVNFTVNNAGKVNGIKLTGSSGSKQVDNAALALVQSIKEVPMSPAQKAMLSASDTLLGTAYFPKPAGNPLAEKIMLVVK